MKLGDLAFGQRDDADSREFQLLEERGDIGLVATDPVQRLRQQDVELAVQGIAHQPLPGHRMVLAPEIAASS